MKPATEINSAAAVGPQLAADLAGLFPVDVQVPQRAYAVASQLAAWGAPEYLIQLSLALSAVEAGLISPPAIGCCLGSQAAATATALAAFARVPRPALQSAEASWKLFMLGTLQPAGAVIKVAQLLTGPGQRSITTPRSAAEALSAAAHVCERLGMWQVRGELLDMQARLNDPHLVQRAAQRRAQSQPAQLRFFERLRQQLTTVLRSHNLHSQIVLRPRPIYHVLEEGLDSSRGTFTWSDVVAILIEQPQECYRALGIINSHFPVQGSKVRDYLGGPRDNGYRAIHTVIVYDADAGGSHSLPIELRITTPAIDRYNSDGFLAYLRREPQPPPDPWWADAAALHEAREIYAGRGRQMFVFTPLGKPVLLDRNATVVDFAVRVHSDLGIYCRGALVNGHRMPPNTPLSCADICEVLIEQHGGPVDEQLLKSATSRVARAAIRRSLQAGQAGAERGRQVFRQVLAARLADHDALLSQTRIDQLLGLICRARGYANPDAFYRAVARGEAAPDQAVRKMVSHLFADRLSLDAIPPAARARLTQVRFASCCWPRPDTPAVAFLAADGRTLKVHTASCHVIAEAVAAGVTVYPAAWKPGEERIHVAEAVFEGWDSPGLIAGLSQALQSVEGLNIRSFHADVPRLNLAHIQFTFEVPRRDQLDQIRLLLEGLPMQRRVELTPLPLLDGDLHCGAPLENPYHPGPVHEWPLFVGRQREVQEVLSHLSRSSGMRHVLLHGPKRIGKTSLLKHLSQYHLGAFVVTEVLNLQSLPTEELRFARLLSRLSALIVARVGRRASLRRLSSRALEANPIGVFAAFLEKVVRRAEARVVVPIDELGVVLSRYDLGRSQEFFDQWRAFLNDERIYRHLALIVVMPDAALARGLGSSAYRVGELGHPVALSVLGEHEARELIATPTNSHLEYLPGQVDRLLGETGQHPYYIHLVCSQIVHHHVMQQRRSGPGRPRRRIIADGQLDAALLTVQQHSDAFHHVLYDSTPTTGDVLRLAAALSDGSNRTVSRRLLAAELAARGYADGEQLIDNAVRERSDLLTTWDTMIRIQIGLVTRWLRCHAPEQTARRL